MKTRRFNLVEIEDLDMKEIGSQPWRHGRRVTYVVEVGGAFWRFEINVHHEEGWQGGDAVDAVQVHEVEKTVKVWEAVP